MDDLYNLISEIVIKQINSLNLNKTVPCKVIKTMDNENVEVELISNKAHYIVPNYSGSPLNAGETVQLFYKGIITNNNAYVGASLNKEIEVSDEKYNLNYIQGKSEIGGTLSTGTKITTIGFTNSRNCHCFVVLNITFTGTQSNNITIKTFLDGTELSYAPQITTVESESTHFSCTIPITADSGDHVVNIMCYGVGYVESANCFVFGMNIEKYIPYEPTDQNDYRYTVENVEANIIYYIGKTESPEIPATLSGAATTKLLVTSFDHSDVERVKIPEGVVEIE